MPPAEGIDVKGSINDREEPFVGVGETEEGSDLIPITIDCALLNKKLEASGANPRVQISVGNGEGVQFTGLTGQTVKNMEQLGAVLEICTRLAEYTLPADLLDIDGVAEQYGQGVDLQDIRVDIKVASPLPESVRIVEDAGRGGNVSILVPPVEFTIECSCNGRIVEVASFKAPVERTIPIPKGIDPDRVTTGVVVERDGTLRHVPTRIVEIDGIYYAKISSLTNSIYTLIWNQVKFRDMEGHWAKEYVNDLGSRLVVAGTSGDIYSPDRPVTRAELAAIITRALGVKSQTGGSEFTDVSAGDWFLGAVNAAAEYGIVSGYSDRTFRPMQMITREEGFAMIAKALELANLKNRTVIEMTSLQTEKVAEPADLKTGTAMELKETQVIEILGKFTDKESLSSWCEKPAAFVIVNGLVAGYDGKLMPQSRITRAEAATMVKQMLKNAELINR